MKLSEATIKAIAKDPSIMERVDRLSAMDYNLLTDEEHEFLQSVMPEQVNPCQGCSFCCKAPAIEAEKITDSEASLLEAKPAGDICKHCTAPGHCAIYDKRPRVCSGYMCSYAMGDTKHKPSDIGVAWSYQVGNIETSKGRETIPLLVGHAMDAHTALMRREVQDDIAVFFSMGFRVIAIRDPKGAIQLYVERGRVLSRTALIDPNDPMRITLLPETEGPGPYLGEIYVEKA